MDQDKKEKRLVIIAGPNGSGKSTLTDYLKNIVDFGEYINADEITLDIIKSSNTQISQNDATRAAQKEADRLREKALKEGINFSFETVMSHPSKIDFMRIAKQDNYYIDFYFVGLMTPDLNKERVHARVSIGGHNVPVDKIYQRYERSMNLLPSALELSDRAAIFDNSKLGSEMLLAATIEKGEITLNENAPEWVVNVLTNFLGKTEAMKNAARLVVMNGQNCFQVKNETGDWTTKGITKAGGIKPGVYMISGASQADKLRTYTGFVLHSDDSCIYQQADKTIVRHALRDFEDQPSCGKSYKIMYAASGKAVTAPAEVQKRGRSLGR